MQLTRRACLLGIGTLLAPRPAAALGVHVTGRLTATDQEAQEGYFALCAASGACHPEDALAISAHAKSPLLGPLRSMVGRTVQVSIFTPTPL